jgi:hypothetical protein
MRVFMLWLGAWLGAVAAPAGDGDTTRWERGSRVSLQVAVDDEAAPLYPSRDGTRVYVEAHKGRRYELRLANRSGERVGVELTVDGLNVISGERDRPGPGRMYILDAGEQTTIRGWRSSLDEVRAFTFVDEQVSYATRSGKANGKMGWIEMAVYRERRRPQAYDEGYRQGGGRDRAVPAESEESRRKAEAEPPAAAESESEARGDTAQRSAPAAPAPGSSYPGTGWGDRLNDRVRLVDFEAESAPAERVTVRYEYRAALVALGVLPRHDRLHEREHGELGFAPPPRW